MCALNDENKLMNRMAVGYRGGFIKRSEARSPFGFPVTPDDEVYVNETAKSPDAAVSNAKDKKTEN